MLIVPGILSTYQSLKDRTLKLVFETNEPTPEQLIEISKSVQKFGFIAFKEDAFKDNEKKVLESLESEYEETGKTKSQRLRAVLFRNFEQKNDGYQVFDDYYNHHMQIMINHWKNKLD